MKTGREMRSHEIKRALRFAGVIPDYSLASIHKVQAMLNKQIAAGKLVMRKEGPHRSSAAFYALVYDEDEDEREGEPE